MRNGLATGLGYYSGQVEHGSAGPPDDGGVQRRTILDEDGIATLDETGQPILDEET